MRTAEVCEYYKFIKKKLGHNFKCEAFKKQIIYVSLCPKPNEHLKSCNDLFCSWTTWTNTF